MNYRNLILDEKSEHPLYLQLADRLRQAIKRGEVINGERLPSIRRLSRELRVNPATVVSAYRILEREAWVRSRPEAGFMPGESRRIRRRNISKRLSGLASPMIIYKRGII